MPDDAARRARGGGKTITYGQLLGGKVFNVKLGSQYNLAPSQPPAPSVAQSVASTGSGSSQSLAAAEVPPTPPFVPSPGQGLSPGAPGTKPLSLYKLVGVEPGPPRVDIPDKITGRYTYVQNVRIPGVLHGRIVRPRGQGAYGDGTNRQVLSVDERSIAHIPGGQVARSENFIGDTGLTVYPEGVRNQAVGSLVQGASRALSEEVTFTSGR